MRRSPPRTRRCRRRALDELFDQRAPSCAEYGLARVFAIRGQSSVRDRRASPGLLASLRNASTSASGSPGGTRSALSPSRSSSRAAGVSAVITGSPHASAWNTLFGMTRRAFGVAPKMPSAQPARCSSSGRAFVFHPRHATPRSRAGREQLLELTAADDAELQLRRAPRGLEDRLQPVERDQLADEQRGELASAAPSPAEDALFGADEADLDALCAAPSSGKNPRAPRCRRRRDRRRERGAVDRTQRARRQRARREPRAIRDERVAPARRAGRRRRAAPRAARFAAGRSSVPR